MSNNWTREQAEAYMRRRLSHEQRRLANKHHENRNQAQLPAPIAQPDHGSALVSPSSRETAGSTGAPKRLKITFIVRSQRPRDWDNSCTKFLQDRLIEAGIIPSDKWDVLQGQVISCKADSKEDEGTTVIIESNANNT